MADKREFIKLDIGYLSNPKIAGLLIAKRPLAVLLHIECMTYSRQHRTDGIVPVAMALRGVIGATKRDVTACIDAGLLVDRGNGDVEVHDYLEHQESAEQIAARSAAAVKANTVRWSGSKRASDSESDSEPDANRNPTRNPEERRGEKRREEQHSSAVADATADASGPRPDVDKILDHLDDRVRANGFKPPTRTQRNTTAARLLIDHDGYTLDQVLWIIDWATSDEFWRANIRSASKLREKFETLKAQATSRGQRKTGQTPARPSRDQWLDR